MIIRNVIHKRSLLLGAIILVAAFIVTSDALFEKIEEIMNVRGIGEKTFVKLQKHLTVGGESKKSSSSKKLPKLV